MTREAPEIDSLFTAWLHHSAPRSRWQTIPDPSFSTEDVYGTDGLVMAAGAALLSRTDWRRIFWSTFLQYLRGKRNDEIHVPVSISNVSHVSLPCPGLLQTQLPGNQEWLPDPSPAKLLHGLQARIIVLHWKNTLVDSIMTLSTLSWVFFPVVLWETGGWKPAWLHEGKLESAGT